MHSAAKPQPVTAGQSPMPLVLIHGWGSNRNVWAPLIDALGSEFHIHSVELPGHGDNPARWPSRTERLLEDWANSLPDTAAYLGWSLGGSLALRFAARYPTRVSALITLATNPCFVQRTDWKLGMREGTFIEFQGHLAADPAGCLRRFAGLQAMGDDKVKVVRRTLLQQAKDRQPDLHGLASGLETLVQCDLRDALHALVPPHLGLFGAEDTLVPVGVTDRLPDRSSHWTLAGCGHAPQLSRPEAVAARVADFLRQSCQDLRPQRDKRQVAQAFGRAEAYDRVAALQQDTGNALLHFLPQHLPQEPVDRLLDLGCGTGFFAKALKTRSHTLVGLDISEGMLRRARDTGAVAHWLCGDAENLPVANGSIDQVFSSLAIQWCENLTRLAKELSRVLRPGGEAAIATLGPDTLWELRAAWRAVDSNVHVNRFASPEQLQSAFADAGLEVIGLRRDRQIRRTASVMTLARELRAIGAHNVNSGRQTGLTGKRHWQQLDAAYRTLGDKETDLPVTWAIDYYRLRKPVNS